MVTETARKYVTQVGFNAHYGARPILGIIRKEMLIDTDGFLQIPGIGREDAQGGNGPEARFKEGILPIGFGFAGEVRAEGGKEGQIAPFLRVFIIIPYRAVKRNPHLLVSLKEAQWNL